METGTPRKKLAARFFLLESGVAPVWEWLKELGRPDSKTIGEDIATVEYGWPVGMPTCRPMGDSLYEVRTDLPGNRVARVLFCEDGGVMYLLHGFIKKSRTTPKQDIDLARQRQKNVRRRLAELRGQRK
jgi:phage-related protein